MLCLCARTLPTHQRAVSLAKASEDGVVYVLSKERLHCVDSLTKATKGLCVCFRRLHWAVSLAKALKEGVVCVLT